MSKLLLILFISLPLMAFAGNGEILFFKGKVTVNNEIVKKGQKLNEGDKINVAGNSLAILSLSNLDKIKLTANSKLTLEKIGNRKSETSLFLEAGSAFAKVLNENKKEKRNFRLRTKSAVMGVRGTEFFTAYGRKNKNALDDQWMCVKEGRVEISNKDQKKLVNAGEGVFITKGKDITAPKPYEWTKSLNWNLDAKKGDLANNLDFNSIYVDFENQDYD